MVLWQGNVSYINIYPTVFNKDITKGNGETFVLLNRTDKVIKYRIFFKEYTKGKDMTKWGEVYPKSITLRPLEEKEIKVYFIPPDTAKTGKYKTRLIIKQVGVPNQYNEKEIEFMTTLNFILTGMII